LDWEQGKGEPGGGMNIEFLATVAVIIPDPLDSRNLYVEALGHLGDTPCFYFVAPQNH
jgi:hypothetical protein